MSKQSIIMKNGAFLLIILSLLVLQIALPYSAIAEMRQLSEIQNSIFHIGPPRAIFSAKTFVNDRFVDQDQANDFILASATHPYLPLDQDNDPYYVVDHRTLDTDLVILYKYDSIACCPFPAKAYLSRNNILLEDYTNTNQTSPRYYVVLGRDPNLDWENTNYTNRPTPPTVFFNVIQGRDPFYHEFVETFYAKITNNVVTRNESWWESKGGIGYVYDDYVKVMSACWSVWIHKASHVNCPEPAPRQTCLPERPKPQIKIIRYSSENSCIGGPFFPEPPKSTCLTGPKPPERSTPAATNWSYNYNNNFFMDTDNSQENRAIPVSKSEVSDSIDHCPTCK